MKELSNIIIDFLEDRCGLYEWDDFIFLESKNPIENRVREYCNNIPIKFPGIDRSYCSLEGVTELRELAECMLISETAITRWLDSHE